MPKQPRKPMKVPASFSRGQGIYEILTSRPARRPVGNGRDGANALTVRRAKESVPSADVSQIILQTVPVVSWDVSPGANPASVVLPSADLERLPDANGRAHDVTSAPEPVQPPPSTPAPSRPPAPHETTARPGPRVIEAGTFQVAHGGPLPSYEEMLAAVREIENPRASALEAKARESMVDDLLQRLARSRPAVAPPIPAEYEARGVIDDEARPRPTAPHPAEAIASRSAPELDEFDAIAAVAALTFDKPATAFGSGSPAPTASPPVSAAPVKVRYDVRLIPQPDKTSCWAGAMAMLVSWYRQQSITPEALADQVGRSLRTSYGWDMLESVKDHFGFRVIPLPSNMSFVPPPEDWYTWLNAYGPLWVTTKGVPSHAIVVHGIEGDLTPEGTTVQVLNPWDNTTAFDPNDRVDFHPPNHGRAYTQRFADFALAFGSLELADYGNWRVLYLGRTPEPFTRTRSRGLGSDQPPPDPFERAIVHFGGTVVRPADFDKNADGFQAYLTATGVRHFTADEMTRPNHPDIAAKLGYTAFLPEHVWWPRGAALALIADQIRTTLNEPVRMRNWWRPDDYNRQVGGVENSDHTTAHGIDLDYRSADSRRQAERWLNDLDTREPWLELSLGLGNLTTHVGILSPRGRRHWTYDGYVP